MKSLTTRTVVFTLAMAAAQFGDAAELTFDEVPFQSANRLSVDGVTFHFQVDGVDSDDAFYSSFGPGDLEFISDPSLTGNSAGLLTIDFDIPTPDVRFGVALNTGDRLSPGFTVELFDQTGGSRASIAVDTQTASGVLGFSEAGFSYSGSPVATLIVDFASGPDSFAFDNLAYVVPEPGALTMSLMCMLALCKRKKRKTSLPIER